MPTIYKILRFVGNRRCS